MNNLQDEQFMRKAMKLACKGKGRTSPNPLVGALVVRAGRVVGEGWHHYCGGDHAEIIALRKAGTKTRGAKLFVTLEPCSHYGRTPPCVDAIFQSGIKEVVIGMRDPNPVNNGRSIRALRSNGIRVREGILQADLRRMNDYFIKYITKGMPFFTAKSAQTLDGKIATKNGDSKWITSEASRAFAHELRNDFDAIMVGINTVLADDPSLSPVPLRKNIKKIVVDSRLRLPPTARIFRGTLAEDVWVATTSAASPQKRAQLEKRGVNILECPHATGGVDLTALGKLLAQMEIANVLIEGGSTLLGSALKIKLVDKWMCLTAPKVLGDERALGSVRGLRAHKIRQALMLKQVTVRKIGPDILVEGYLPWAVGV